MGKLYDRENILVNRGCTSQRLSESTFVELEHPDQEDDQIVDPISLGSMEEVTMKVLPENIEVWLRAEKETWKPWLEKQRGFLGRKLLYNKTSSEAKIILFWKERFCWQDLDQTEVMQVVNAFNARAAELSRCETNVFETVPKGREWYLLHEEQCSNQL